jgi:hypothetical protein
MIPDVAVLLAHGGDALCDLRPVRDHLNAPAGVGHFSPHEAPQERSAAARSATSAFA